MTSISIKDYMIPKTKWMKKHPLRRYAIQILLEIGEAIEKTAPGIEQQILSKRWDTALECLRAIESRLHLEWEKFFQSEP